MTDPIPSVAPLAAGSRRPHRGRAAGGSVVALVVVALVASAALARTSSGPSYRTATVTRAEVAQQLDTSGTVEPVSEASVSFPTSGTVASVAIDVGDTVTTGEVLATLDTTSLQATLDQQEASLAQARLTLANAESGQSTTASQGSGGSGATVPSGSGSSGSGGSGTTTTTAATTTPSSVSLASSGSASSSGARAVAQQAVLADQQQLDQDLALAQADLAAAQTACASSAPASSSGATTSTTIPTVGSTTTACLDAQRQLLTDQTAVSNTETTLAQAERTLDGLLSSSTGSPSGTSSPSSSSTSSSSTSSSSSSTRSTTVTAEELVADQAAVDAAAQEVAVAQQSLDQASIVSPIDGTVADVELGVGGSVSADSSTPAVVVAGTGGDEVATTVSVTNRTKLELGDTASVVADGTTRVLAGKAVAIGVAGTTSGSSTTYPVVIGFDSTPSGLRNGASASVVIDLASVAAATAVPTSAVHTSGTTHTVTVLDGSKTRTVEVTIGVVGAQLTQVRSGLHLGQTVVLADMGQPLPSSDSSATTRRPGLTSGLSTGSGGSGGSGTSGFGGGGFGGGSGGPP